MQFDLNKAIQILERTPRVVQVYLTGLPEDLLRSNEGVDTWSPYDVVGHLIFGEKTDWIVRIRAVLTSVNPIFEPFDRFAQFQEDQDRPIIELLEEFSNLRSENIAELVAFNISSSDLSRTGVHPAFGDVTIAQLISAWVVHDLGHISQISRVMAKQYKTEVGPWTAYLEILSK